MMVVIMKTVKIIFFDDDGHNSSTSCNNLLIAMIYEHIGLVVRMSILDTEVDGSNPSISMFSP